MTAHPLQGGGQNPAYRPSGIKPVLQANLGRGPAPYERNSFSAFARSDSQGPSPDCKSNGQFRCATASS